MVSVNADQYFHEPNTKRLCDHVFGANGVSQMLLNDGKFPEGWVTEYLRLLQIAADEWREKPFWPKELVSAVHFASWYLSLRYESWTKRTEAHNKITERELSSIRSPSELFLMLGSLK